MFLWGFLLSEDGPEYDQEQLVISVMESLLILYEVAISVSRLSVNTAAC